MSRNYNNKPVKRTANEIVEIGNNKKMRTEEKNHNFDELLSNHKKELVITLDMLSSDVFGKIFDFINCFDACGLVYASKFLNKMFFDSISIIIAMSTNEALKITEILRVCSSKTNKLLNIKTVAAWCESGEIDESYIQSNFFHLVSSCENLVEVSFGRKDIFFSRAICDFYLLEKCKKLKYFEIDGLNLNNSELSFLEKMPNLVSCRLRGTDGSTGTSILGFLQHSKQLKAIGVWQKEGKIKIRDLLLLSEMKLNEIILSSCVFLEQSDNQLDVNSENTKALEVLQKMPLKHLGLFFVNLPTHHFEQLLKIKTLESLQVGGCFDIKMSALEKLHCLRNLTKLSLSRVNTLFRDGIKKIAEHPTLSILRISNSITIRDYDLEPLIDMDNLFQLDIDNCYIVSDITIFNICKCKKLSHVSLISLYLLSDNGIAQFENLSSLKFLSIKKCFGVTNHGIDNLKKLHMNFWINHARTELIMFDRFDHSINLIIAYRKFYEKVTNDYKCQNSLILKDFQHQHSYAYLQYLIEHSMIFQQHLYFYELQPQNAFAIFEHYQLIISTKFQQYQMHQNFYLNN